jgi:hypothetical protein
LVLKSSNSILIQIIGFGLAIGGGENVISIRSTNDGGTTFSNWESILTGTMVGKSVQGWDALLQSIASLTGANGSFIGLTGAAAAAVKAIVGTVSQSGGVATGSIVEVGSNANGSYIKFAGGLLLCFGSVTVGTITNSAGSLFVSTSTSWTFPAAFATKPFCGGNDGSGSSSIWHAFSQSTTSANIGAYCYTSISSSRTANLVAVGTWY